MEFRSKTAIKIATFLALFAISITIGFLSSRFQLTVTGEAAGLAQRDGATIFSQNCARCHGSDGRARTAKGRAVGATDLTSSDWLPDTARDTRIVTKGKESMPSFKAKLKPAEIEAVVNYIRRFKQ